MDKDILQKATKWSQNLAFDLKFREEIQNLINQNNQEELTDRFYKDLEFGTGGMRGIMGAGSNRFNIYTIRKATQGLADYILQDTSISKPSVAIAYDNRNYSEIFAKEVASVLAGNEIIAYLFPELKPTPMLSFAVRTLQTTAGIMITASHNPPVYNGYKVSWSDGCQITSPHDQAIIHCIDQIHDFCNIQRMDFEVGQMKEKIKWIPKSIDDSFYKQVTEISVGDAHANEALGVVYTPLHGTGLIPIQTVCEKRNFKQFRVVPSQAQPDGNFSTVSSPNPEEELAFEEALKCVQDQDTLILATDPDADRVGAMVKHSNQWVRLNGNQIGQLLIKYYLEKYYVEKLKEKNPLSKTGVYISTIVTSELGKKIASSYGLHCIDTLTGFKYIGRIIGQLEQNKQQEFIFGTEESHGYLFTDFIRDKDAVGACMMFAEMTAMLKQNNKTPLDFLDEIHQEYGYHQDSLINKVIPGHTGAMEIQNIMKYLRSYPPQEIGNKKVVYILDYQQQVKKNIQNKEEKPYQKLDIANVLSFHMEDQSRITARPSGTEPKIKFYFNLCGDDQKKLEEQKKHYETSWMKIIDSIT